MSESRKRSEVVSTRFSTAELEQLQALAGDRGMSTFLRDAVLAATAASKSSSRPQDGWNPHAQAACGEAWTLHYAPGRVISILRAPGYQANGVAVWTASDARRLAAALLVAADVAEQPEPGEAAA